MNDKFQIYFQSCAFLIMTCAIYAVTVRLYGKLKSLATRKLKNKSRKHDEDTRGI